MDLRRWIRRATSPRDIGLRRFHGALRAPGWPRRLPPVACGRAPAIGDVFAFGRWIAPATTRRGDPDWHVDPIGSVRWPPATPTSAIAMRSDDRPGDVKHVWEPARFLHLFDLCRREGAGDVAAAHVASWIDQNPRGLGVHWDNALEASLRAISWTHADGWLAGSSAAWDRARTRLLSALWHHGDFIASHLSTGQYNHLVGDATGLAVLGASYPDLPDAAAWRRTGVDVLRTEIARQVLPDGSHAELAPAYARFVADLYLLAGHVAGEDELVAAAQRLLTTLQQQATPDGALPGHGDDDGATVLWPVAPADRLRVSTAFASALSGAAVSRPRPGATLLESAGLCVFRSTADARADWILLRGGPMGVAHGAHAHADLLSIQCTGPNLPPIVDPGTPTYNGDDTLRTASTATPAHSTVSIDGRSQAVRTGRFGWSDMPHARDVACAFDEGVWRAHASVQYTIPEGAVAHRREVVFGRGVLCVRDRVRCSGHHRAQTRLLIGGEARWDAATGRLHTADGRRFALERSGWQRVVAVPAHSSPGYGLRDRALALELEGSFADAFEATWTLRVCRG